MDGLQFFIEQDEQRTHRGLYERNFWEFCKAAWPLLSPKDHLDPECWYARAIAEHLQAVAERRINRLLISVCPRSGKSSLVSILYGAWRWAVDPRERLAYWSFNESLSTRFSVKRRDVITSPWFQRLWGNRFALKEDQNEKAVFWNDRGGQQTVLVSAMGSGAGDGLILDDAHPVGESDLEREKTVEFVRGALLTRLDRPAESPVIIIGQRTDSRDIIGTLLDAEGSQWTFLDLPAECREPQTVHFPISGRVFERPAGHLLDPVRMPKAWLERQKADMGVWQFETQYNQNPQPKSGVIVDPAWWRYHEFFASADWPSLFPQVVLSVDTAVTKSEQSCDVAILTFGIRDLDIFLLDVSTRKRNYVETKQAIRACAARAGTRELLIEAKSSGDQVALELGQEFFITKVTPTTDKVSRLQLASAPIQSGHVYLPKNGTGAAIANLCARAPHCKMDSMDALSQAVTHFAKAAQSCAWLKTTADFMRTGFYSDGTRVGAYPGERKPLTTAEKYRVVSAADMPEPDPPDPKKVPEFVQGDAPPAACACGGSLFLGAGSGKCQSCGKLYSWRRV